MKKAILLSILVIVLLTLPAAAQIEEKLPANIDTMQNIVIKGRQKMIDLLMEKDYPTIRQSYRYLDEITLEKDNTPFDYTEYLYLNLLLGNWNVLTDYMMEYGESEQMVPYPVNDPLKTSLMDHIAEISDSLLIKSQNAPIDNDGKSVINMLVHLIKNDKPDHKYYSLLDQHNKTFKESAYKDFIVNYLPAPKLKEAYSFSLGSGMIFPTGKLEERFSQKPSFYASLDFNYHRVFGSFHVQAAGLKLKVPFILEVEGEKINYLKNDIFNYQDFGIKGGYLLVRSSRFHMGPYATINGIILSTTDYTFLERLLQKAEDDENWEYKLIYSFCAGGGMHTEIKLLETHKMNKTFGLIDNYLSIKADAGYNYIIDHDMKLFQGNTWYYYVALVYGIGIF